MRDRGRGLGVLASAGVLVLLAGCSLGGDDDAEETSVFSVEEGQCFEGETEPQALISDLNQVECSVEHGLESYAVVPFEAPEGVQEIDAYPGDDALNKFAQGACAESFGEYVGVSYLDSSLYYTYLVPSPRSWEDDDRNVICFVVATGRPLEGSAKGSKL